MLPTDVAGDAGGSWEPGASDQKDVFAEVFVVNDVLADVMPAKTLGWITGGGSFGYCASLSSGIFRTVLMDSLKTISGIVRKCVQGHPSGQSMYERWTVGGYHIIFLF